MSHKCVTDGCYIWSNTYLWVQWPAEVKVHLCHTGTGVSHSHLRQGLGNSAFSGCSAGVAAVPSLCSPVRSTFYPTYGLLTLWVEGSALAGFVV